MKFIHSADWQLGARFSNFGERAEALRAVRPATLRRTLERARAEAADAFVVAGDLFEDNQVEDSLVREVMALFEAFPDVPVFILPGNHDPLCGPGCIWERPPFREPPAHVTVFREPRACPVAGGWFLAAPLTQKKSPRDPSLALADLAREVAGAGPRAGVTHGSPAIESKHQPDDHPVHLEAASRAGLDYLALGHWHRWQVFDGGRMVMPGTPEPDGFDPGRPPEGAAPGEAGSAGPRGRVALVDLPAAGAPPKVTPLETGSLRWIALDADLPDWDACRARLEEKLSGPDADPEHTVLRLTLRGAPDLRVREAADAWLDRALGAYFARIVDDRTVPALSEAEATALRREHAVIARVMDDLEAAAALVGGRRDDPPSVGGLTLKQLEALAAERKQDWREFDESFWRTAREVLHRELREVTS